MKETTKRYNFCVRAIVTALMCMSFTAQAKGKGSASEKVPLPGEIGAPTPAAPQAPGAPSPGGSTGGGERVDNSDIENK